MVGTILPMGHGTHPLGKLCIPLYIIGSVIGAASFGAVLSYVGTALGFLIGATPLHSNVAVAVTGVLSLLCSLRECGVMRLRLPQINRQVPHRWRFLHPGAAALLYGAVLGIGVLTRIPVSGLYVLSAWACSAADAVFGTIAFAGFGLGRGLVLLWAQGWLPTCDRNTRRQYLYTTLPTLKPVMHQVDGIALALFAAWALAGVFTDV